ncbi:MAG: hypothetical protein AB9903_21565 [Vulcanimicrobiota bacterium]
MPYSWGDDTGFAAESESEGGYDYASARAAYSEDTKARSSDKSAGKSDRKSLYESAGKAQKGTEAPVGKELVTDSAHPIVIMVDVTGSMSTWPEIIFEKLPLLGQEVERYFTDYAISFTAVGDADCDSYPLQVRDFAKGPALDDHLKNLYPEGGGGDIPESYDLAAYYYLNHCTMERAIAPISILVCDAPPHDELKASAVKKYVGDTVQSNLDSAEIIRRLAGRFSFYLVLKDFSPADDTTKYWQNLLGRERVLPFQEPRDIVEVLIGIIALEAGAFEDFRGRVTERHTDKPDRVTRVMRSLKTVLAAVTKPVITAARVGKKDGASTKSARSKKLI